MPARLLAVYYSIRIHRTSASSYCSLSSSPTRTRVHIAAIYFHTRRPFLSVHLRLSINHIYLALALTTHLVDLRTTHYHHTTLSALHPPGVREAQITHTHAPPGLSVSCSCALGLLFVSTFSSAVSLLLLAAHALSTRSSCTPPRHSDEEHM